MNAQGAPPPASLLPRPGPSLGSLCLRAGSRHVAGSLRSKSAAARRCLTGHCANCLGMADSPKTCCRSSIARSRAPFGGSTSRVMWAAFGSTTVLQYSHACMHPLTHRHPPSHQQTAAASCRYSAPHPTPSSAKTAAHSSQQLTAAGTHPVPGQTQRARPCPWRSQTWCHPAACPRSGLHRHCNSVFLSYALPRRHHRMPAILPSAANVAANTNQTLKHCLPRPADTRTANTTRQTTKKSNRLPACSSSVQLKRTAPHPERCRLLQAPPSLCQAQ